MLNIAFVHNGRTNFTEIDHELLGMFAQVEEVFYPKKKAILKWSLISIILRSDLVFCWFASWHSLLPLILCKLRRCPFLLVTGGFDTANIPEAGYGHQRKWWTRWLVKICIRNADKVICNSHFIREEVMALGFVRSEKLTVIHHGIPAHIYQPVSKSLIALNIGNVFRENLLRKGLLPFVQSSAFLPNWTFIQVGAWKDNSMITLQENGSANCHIKGYLSDQDLHDLFSKASVYVQPSFHEGFGLSVIEAMQAGCIPVVSNRGALPEVIKGFGIILDDLSPENIARGILRAEAQFGHRRIEIAEMVNQNYSLEHRGLALKHLLAAWI